LLFIIEHGNVSERIAEPSQSQRGQKTPSVCHTEVVRDIGDRAAVDRNLMSRSGSP
jgi:hypothetical protein